MWLLVSFTPLYLIPQGRELHLFKFGNRNRFHRGVGDCARTALCNAGGRRVPFYTHEDGNSAGRDQG